VRAGREHHCGALPAYGTAKESPDVFLKEYANFWHPCTREKLSR
jgi:hypothetical protein